MMIFAFMGKGDVKFDLAFGRLSRRPRSDTIRAGLRHSELGSFQVGCEPRRRCRASLIPRGAHGLSRVPFHGQLGEL